MPNLVVYVPAGLARELEALGVSVEVQRRACHAAVKALAERGLGAGEPTAVVAQESADASLRRGAPVSRTARPAESASPAPNSFRPDPKGGSKK